MREVPVTWSNAIQVWWALWWRAMAYGLGVGFAFGFLFGVSGHVDTFQALQVSPWFPLCLICFSAAIFLVVTKRVLDAKWKTFRIVLIASSPNV